MKNLKFVLRLVSVNLAIVFTIYLALAGGLSFIELENMWNVSLWTTDQRIFMTIWSLFIMAIFTGVITTIEVVERKEGKR